MTLTNYLAKAIPLNPAYFTLKVMQTTVTHNSSGTSIDFTNLEYELCDIEIEFADMVSISQQEWLLACISHKIKTTRLLVTTWLITINSSKSNSQNAYLNEA